jgi:hypothetical protein
LVRANAGDFEEEIPCSWNDEEKHLLLNPDFLADALATLGSDEASFLAIGDFTKSGIFVLSPAGGSDKELTLILAGKIRVAKK